MVRLYMDHHVPSATGEVADWKGKDSRWECVQSLRSFSYGE